MNCPYTGRKIVSPLDMQEFKTVNDDPNIYAVSVENRTSPVAFFLYHAHAKEWADNKYPGRSSVDLVLKVGLFAA